MLIKFLKMEQSEPLPRAEASVHLTQENKTKEFGEIVGRLDNADNAKAAKRKAEDIAK